jgi:NAD(P)-dependent dehydrogenase (short-subunit alcohol dehydrogenase family)
VVDEIKAEGGIAVANYDSVATMQGRPQHLPDRHRQLRQMDILVNNAGILRDKTIFKMTEEEWDLVIAVHLKGTFTTSQPFARYIRETNRENCRIVNFSSISGLMGQLRPVQLLGRQGRHRRLHPHAGAGAGQIQVHRQRLLAGGHHPHDR